MRSFYNANLKTLNVELTPTMHSIPLQAATLLKMYIKQEIYFYQPLPGGGVSQVPAGANLMDYSGQTLYMSEEVSKRLNLGCRHTCYKLFMAGSAACRGPFSMDSEMAT